MRGDAWDGPILSCYCQDAAGNWDLAEVNLSEYLATLFLPFLIRLYIFKTSPFHTHADGLRMVDHHVGNEGGFLSCGTVIGTKTCKYPWTTEDGVVQSELR